MKLKNLVRAELTQRKSRLFTSLLAIVLGIAIITFINNVTIYSKKAIEREVDALGANILILPKDSTVENYYSADLSNAEMPEEYLSRLLFSNLEGLDNLSPKLSFPIQLKNQKVTLTGILPKNEFQGKASWRGAGIFSRPKSCGNVQNIFSKKKPTETLVRKRVIETLKMDEVLVGAEVAKKLDLKEGESLTLLGSSFNIIAILPQTGTIDDSRLFVNLHKVQELTGKENVVSAIEVVGCCNQISKGLVEKIKKIIPEAKVVTILQVVETQLKTNQTMHRLSLLFLAVIILIGGASIANDMYSNVSERKREIGTLIALGATSKTILRLFLMKAAILGLLGGTIGFLVGETLAIFLGPLFAKVPVLPEWYLLPLSIGLSLFVTLAASYLPAKKASQLDPSTIMQEI